MKLKIQLLVAASVVAITLQISFAALQAPLPEFKSKASLQKATQQKQEIATVADKNAFYTGKPYESNRGYLFKYRSYDPALARWSSSDPSGFPDGANNSLYVSNDPTALFDFQGLTGKSVLWVTITNLFGNGNLWIDPNNSSNTFNYMADFNSKYTSTKQGMQTDDGKTPKPHYLDDGDIFDKYAASDNNSLQNVADGYTEVYFITHGSNSTGTYQFMAPDGTMQNTSFFSNLMGCTSVIMETCFNGYVPSGGNTSGGTGAFTTISWDDAVTASIAGTRAHLFE